MSENVLSSVAKAFGLYRKSTTVIDVASALSGGGTSDVRKGQLPPVSPRTVKQQKKKKGDDSSPPEATDPGLWNATTATVLPSFLNVGLKAFLGITVALYVMNQTHNLPKPISALVSKYLFWPTLPITVSKRIGKWVTDIDDTVVLGGAPFGFANIPERLYNDYGVSLWTF